MTSGEYVLVNVEIAYASIMAHKLRSSLTMLGVLIGVTSIILVAALSEAAEFEITQSVNALGTNMVMIFPVADSSGSRVTSRRGRLTESDARALLNSTRAAVAVAPQLRTMARLNFDGNYANVSVFGVGEGYFAITKTHMEQGRLFNASEIQTQARVVLLSSSTAKKLFGEKSALGNIVRVNRIPFTVVGTFKSSGGTLLGDQDNFVLIPISTVRQRLGYASANSPESVDVIFVQYQRNQPLNDARNDAVNLLRQRYRVKEGEIDPFTVYTTEEFAKQSDSIIDVLRIILGSIASISLIVGGIGIMNIMLVSVTERIREIGVRMAVGASAADIRWQFLVESVFICLFGGLTGSVLATAIALICASLTGWHVQVTVLSLLFAVAFSGLVGVVAGLVPAYRASRLDPIEALRHD